MTRIRMSKNRNKIIGRVGVHRNRLKKNRIRSSTLCNSLEFFIDKFWRAYEKKIFFTAAHHFVQHIFWLWSLRSTPKSIRSLAVTESSAHVNALKFSWKRYVIRSLQYLCCVVCLPRWQIAYAVDRAKKIRTKKKKELFFSVAKLYYSI